MLESYLFPIRYALLTFPLAALLFTLPFLIVQYRKYGYVNGFRGFAMYALLLYMITAYYLVILPLPDTVHTCTGPGKSYIQPVPLQFVNDFLRETRVRFDQPSTYLLLIQERAVLQVVFNVLLLVPLGLFLQYYFRRSGWQTVSAALVLSLFFETTQLTGLYGIYDCPYRIFDVDDLLLNTLGGWIGYGMGRLFASRLPDIGQLDRNVDLSSRRVGYIRRFVAFQIDWVVLLPFAAFLLVVGRPLYMLAFVLIYFIGVPYATNGYTFGKYIVRIRLKGQHEHIRLQELLMRYGLLYAAIGGLHVLTALAAKQAVPDDMAVFLALFTLGIDILLGFHLLRRLYRRDKGLFYEAISRTKHIIV
ncbi:VanZ family protein [Paenibacillus doosanensis]|uniref:VanZ like family protein n=1 Tax=Paenibacillus konkukensis TaxID=2020716 RepID=A0ABY4RYR5_9BACL|nr:MULTISPECIES: VanZ family protein [Paenibacillus]MCS7464338.1 VanZ family protein [Paenibacillus doosanensis]UQZ87555.1 VanZ like family protein [Paenibacillus konkukensis]